MPVPHTLNQVYAALLGYRPEELHGKSWEIHVENGSLDTITQEVAIIPLETPSASENYPERITIPASPTQFISLPQASIDLFSPQYRFRTVSGLILVLLGIHVTADPDIWATSPVIFAALSSVAPRQVWGIVWLLTGLFHLCATQRYMRSATLLTSLVYIFNATVFGICSHGASLLMTMHYTLGIMNSIVHRELRRRN